MADEREWPCGHTEADHAALDRARRTLGPALEAVPEHLRFEALVDLVGSIGLQQDDPIELTLRFTHAMSAMILTYKDRKMIDHFVPHGTVPS